MKYLLFILVWLIPTVTWAAGVGFSGGASAGNPPGTTYYISTSGNDSNSGRNAGAPWLTLGKIATQVTAGVEPGDKFLLKRGDAWTASASRVINLLNVSGTQTRPVIIGAYGIGADPIIQSGAYATPHILFDIPGANYLTIRDLNLIGGLFTYAFINGDASTYDGGISYINLLRLTLDNSVADQDATCSECGNGVRLYDNYTTAYPATNEYQVNPLHHITVQSSTFKGIGGYDGFGGFVAADKRDCISINPPKGGYLNIHHNTFIECADNAVDIPGEANHRVEYNLVLGGGYGGPSGSLPSLKFHSQYSHVSDSVVRGNVILSGDSYGLVFWNTSGVEIYNNTLFYEPGGNQQVVVMGDNEVAGNFYGTFAGNTFTNNILIGALRLDGTDAPLAPLQNTFSNNIYYNPTTPAHVIYMSTPNEWWTTDYLWAVWAAITTDDLNTNPDLVTEPATFTDWETYGDFSPAVGGAANDGGVDVSGVGDIIGTTIPLGTDPDVGAYEYIP